MRISAFNDEMKQLLLKANDVYLEGYLHRFDNIFENNVKDMSKGIFIEDINNIIRNLDGINSDKVLEFFQENPVILYDWILNDYRKMKIYILKNDKSFNSKIIINNLIRKYRDKIIKINNDFQTKYENGYFN